MTRLCSDQLVSWMLLTNCPNKSNNTTEAIYKSSIIIEFYNIEFSSKNDQYLFGFLVQTNPLCLYLNILESHYISPYHLLLLLTKTDLYFHNLSSFFNTNTMGFGFFPTSVLSIHQIMQPYKHLFQKCLFD